MIAAGWDGQLLHLFRRSSTVGGNLFHQAWDGQQWLPGLTEWENVGGELFSDPAVVSSNERTLDVFAEGPHNNILHKQWAYGSWTQGLTGWETWGEKISGTPSAVSETTSIIDLVWVGPDKHLFHKFDDGFGWKATKKIGGEVAGRPVIVSSHVNRFDVFVKGPNNHLLHKFQDFSDWQPAGETYEDMGGDLHSDPGVASWGAELEVDTPGPLHVFAVGTEQHLMRKDFDGTRWSPGLTGWEGMGGLMHGTPAALSRGRGLVDVVVAGPDDKLFYIGNNGFQWSPFRPLFVTAQGSPVAVARGRNRFDVFYIGSDGGVHHLPYDGSWLEWQNHGGAEL